MRIFLSLISILFLTHFVDAAPANASTHKLKFKIYTWFDDSKSSNEQEQIDTLYFPLGKKMIPLHLNAAELTKEYITTVGERFFLYKKTIGDGDKPVYKPVANAKIPPHLKSAFIYAFTQETKIKLLVIDTSLQAFPKGTVLFLNESEKTVGVKVNKTARLIKSKKRSKHPYTPTKKGTLRIQVKDYTNRKQKPHPNLCVMTVGAREGQRVIAFFYTLESGQHRLLLERGIDNQSIQIPPAE